jgi:hypothetical protein
MISRRLLWALVLRGIVFSEGTGGDPVGEPEQERLFCPSDGGTICPD